MASESQGGIIYIGLTCGHVFELINWCEKTQPTMGGAIPHKGGPELCKSGETELELNK